MGKILVVAEKPSAGSDIAKVLGATDKKNGYYEGEKYIVTWALGHLIGLKDPEEVNEKYRRWNLIDLPLPHDNGLKVMDSTRSQFEIIKKLILREDVDSLINAGDAGREGYLIQSWIYRMAGNIKPVKVLWASSLTEEALKKAFNNLKEDYEFAGVLEEAEARAIGDQKFGYNYSRLLTLTKGGRGTVLSYGRCQTPLLHLIVQRDFEIENFTSVPYFCIECTYAKGFKGMLQNEKGKTINYRKRSDAETLISSLPKEGIVEAYSQEVKEEKAPMLYNLAELQAMAGKKFGYTAEQTLQIAQKLYETHKILSYPRTDSRFLSMDLYGEIKEHIQSCNFGLYTEMIEKINEENIVPDKHYFNDAKVTDHHALIPTINADTGKIYEKLSEEERNIFDEIVRSLIAIFYPPYKYSSTKILIAVGESIFASAGTTIISLGYKTILKTPKETREELQILPKLEKGITINIDDVLIIEKKTTAPTRYNVGNIIKIMEKHGIGTSATRAEIIKKLEVRKYINLDKGKYISTDLGRKYIAIVPEELKSTDMTARFEERLSQINKGILSKRDFFTEIDNDIVRYLKQFNMDDSEKLGEAIEPIGKCPVCGNDIIPGKKNYYCSGYKKGCEFYVMKIIAGKEIPIIAIKQLLQSGITNSISGFNKKDGTGTFNAKLTLDDKKHVAFKFVPRKGLK